MIIVRYSVNTVHYDKALYFFGDHYWYREKDNQSIFLFK